MNGLLHRVAARAAGTSVPVRADARLPYAVGASGWGEAGEAEADPRATASASSALPAAPVPSPFHPATLQEEPVEPGALVDAMRARSLSVAAPILTAVERDALPATAGVSNDSGTKMSVHGVFGELAPIDEVRAWSPPMHLLPSMSPTASVSVEARPSAQLSPHEAAASARPATHFDDPAPLMPRTARPAPLAPVAQPSARRFLPSQGASSANAANGDDSTEVHIHIGRIDVTAVQEAPSPRRRAAAAPPPMSLEGYLAQRGRS